jgi:hypothetical protein
MTKNKRNNVIYFLKYNIYGRKTLQLKTSAAVYNWLHQLISKFHFFHMINMYTSEMSPVELKILPTIHFQS